MSEKLKVYSVSVMAFMAIDDALELSFISEDQTNGEITYIEHLPALIPASTIEEAAERAKEFALNKWQPGAGWYGHQAEILPVTKDFYEAAFRAYKAGVVDTLDDEEGKFFTF
jgi:hypothetical protein